MKASISIKPSFQMFLYFNGSSYLYSTDLLNQTSSALCEIESRVKLSPSRYAMHFTHQVLAVFPSQVHKKHLKLQTKEVNPTLNWIEVILMHTMHAPFQYCKNTRIGGNLNLKAIYFIIIKLFTLYIHGC